MATNNFRNLEDIIYYMLMSLKLSYVDRTFLSNLTQLIKRNLFVTTNQDRLLRLLIDKYRKQLNKQNIDIDAVLKLSFKHKIVESMPVMANIVIENDSIYFKAPFKREFLKELREQNNTLLMMKWIKDTNRYEMPYTISNLYHIKKIAERYYKNITCCPVTTEIIDKLKPYQGYRYWDPTIVYRYGNFLVYGMNQAFYNATVHLSLEPTCKTLADFSVYSIKVDQSVIDYLSQTNSSEKIKFSASYNTEIDYDLQPKVFHWLKELGCDGIFLNNTGSFGYILTQEQLLEIKNLKIPIIKDEDDLIKFKKPVTLYPRFKFEELGNNVFKNIKWLNSRPVKIR